MTDGGKIIQFPGLTYAEMPASQPLEKAIIADLDKVIVVGSTKDGDLWFGGNTSDIETIIFLLEVARKHTMEHVE